MGGIFICFFVPLYRIQNERKAGFASAVARAQGAPFDDERVKLFGILFETLHHEQFPYMDEPNVENSAFRNFAFFESYFSNYIEGTDRAISRVRQFSANIIGDDFETTRKYLEQCNKIYNISKTIASLEFVDLWLASGRKRAIICKYRNAIRIPFLFLT